MEIVIPLSHETTNDYLDLRYALRGFELYVKPEKVYIIGARPGWIQNILHIPATDHPESHQRERNIFEKLLLYPGEEFIYCNDDHMLLAPWKEQYGWDVTLLNKFYGLSRNSNYKKTVANTLRLMPKGNNHDIHCPMVMHRSYLQRMRVIRWNEPFGYAMKSLYTQFAKISGTQMEDCKFRTTFNLRDLKGKDWFSTADGVVEKVLPIMNKIYKNKSRYEQ